MTQITHQAQARAAAALLTWKPTAGLATSDVSSTKILVLEKGITYRKVGNFLHNHSCKVLAFAVPSQWTAAGSDLQQQSCHDRDPKRLQHHGGMEKCRLLDIRVTKLIKRSHEHCWLLQHKEVLFLLIVSQSISFYQAQLQSLL